MEEESNNNESQSGFFCYIWSFIVNTICTIINIIRAIPNNIYLINHNLLDLCMNLNDKYGGGEKMNPIPFTFGLGIKSVLVTKPEHIHQVLTGEGFSRSPVKIFRERFKKLLGFSLITVDLDHHKEVRIRTLDFLTGNSLKNFGNIMIETLENIYLPLWRSAAISNTPIDISKDMFYYSSEVSFRSLLNLPAGVVPLEVHQALNRIFTYVRNNVLCMLPKTNSRQFEKDTQLIQQLIEPLIEQEKESESALGWAIRYHTQHNRSNFDKLRTFINDDECFNELELLYQQRTTNDIFQISKQMAKIASSRIGGNIQYLHVNIASILCHNGLMDKKRLMEEVISNLIGGSETTILMMNWGLYRLALHPHIQQELYEHLPKDNIILSQEQVWNCKYLQNTLTEILRLDSPAYIFPRPAIKDVQIGDLKISKGTVIWGSQYITHRSPYVWDQPDSFNPNRWNQPIKDGSFFTFTLGPRMCPGSRYAYLEAGLAISTLINHFHVSLDPTCDVNMKYDLGLTYRPKTPVKILLTSRN